ncbi:MAG TPA: hypothetical protein VG815_20690, partial [Chloroflexota bacterium]|nr:hypothetical protein [Chloroflexota bacterium]
MPELSPIDPWSAALLVMGYQVDTLIRFMTPAQSADAIACVPDLITMARGAGRGHDGDSCRWRIPARSSRGCGLSLGRRPRLLRRPGCAGACDAA